MFYQLAKINKIDFIISPSLVDQLLETIFLYLDIASLKNCSLVCKDWYRLLVDENSFIWKINCKRLLSYEVLTSDLLSSLTTYKEVVRAFYYAWSPNACSKNILIQPDGFTLYRCPVAISTDACRGKIGFVQGKHTWEIIWDGPLGTIAIVGIATEDAPLSSDKYIGLLGSDKHTWGWNLIDNNLVHNGYIHGTYGLRDNIPQRQSGERIRVTLDCDDNTLSFEKNYECLGVAFRDLPATRLYPSLSIVYGDGEVSMVYIGSQRDDNTFV